MSFLTRTFSQVIARSATTTTLLLKPGHARSLTLLSASTSTEPSQQNKYEYLLVDIKGKDSNVALVQLNRPKALNALCDGLMKEV
jgi:hypothetical protein